MEKRVERGGTTWQTPRDLPLRRSGLPHSLPESFFWLLLPKGLIYCILVASAGRETSKFVTPPLRGRLCHRSLFLVFWVFRLRLSSISSACVEGLKSLKELHQCLTNSEDAQVIGRIHSLHRSSPCPAPGEVTLHAQKRHENRKSAFIRPARSWWQSLPDNYGAGADAKMRLSKEKDEFYVRKLNNCRMLKVSTGRWLLQTICHLRSKLAQVMRRWLSSAGRDGRNNFARRVISSGFHTRRPRIIRRSGHGIHASMHSWQWQRRHPRNIKNDSIVA
jgi:hypothetical protein